MERSVDREPLSRIAIGAVVASAGGVSYALATAKETSYAWMSTGHSPVVWLVLAVVATHLGTFRQALFVVPAVLVVSVIVYYAVLADHGRAVLPFPEPDGRAASSGLDFLQQHLVERDILH